MPFLFLLRKGKKKKVLEMEHMEKRVIIQRDEDLDGFLVSSTFRGQEGSIINEASGDRKQLAVLGILMSCKAPCKKATTLPIPEDRYHKYGRSVARCSICFKEPENPDSCVKSLAF